MPKRRDLTNVKIGRLLVISYDQTCNLWLCVCSCGTSIKMHSAALTRKRYTQSCGCLRKERLSASNTVKKRYKDNLAAKISVYRQYERNALRRSKQWDLSKETVLRLIDMECFYCGKVGSLTSKVKTGTYVHNGIDRIDNSIGYTETNVVSCCKQCNIAKGVLSREDFIEWIHRASNHLKDGMNGCRHRIS